MRAHLTLPLVLVLGSGCQNTGAENDPLIPDELVRRAVQLTSTLSLVAAETALVAADPPEGFGTCPAVDEDGNQFTYTYEACVPDSGLTEDALSGTITLTVAGGSGAFTGSITALGVGDNTVTAAVQGSSSTAGDLLNVDIDFSDGVWVPAGRDLPFDAFVELQGNADEVSAFVDSALLQAENGEDLFFDVEDVTTPRGTMGTCSVPAGGAIDLFGDVGRSGVIFSEENNASGSFTATHNDRDPSTIVLCP